jgi:ParB-like nuclease family protein
MDTSVYVDKSEGLPEHVDEIVAVDISLLKFDAENPNVFTKKQMSSLQDVIKKFGYLVPIISDTQGNIIDGEHRALAYKQLGYENIPTLVIDSATTEVEKKFLRQWLNKFRGQHDLEKDINEQSYIIEDEVGAALMENYLEITEQTVDQLAASLKDEDPSDSIIDETEHQFPIESHRKIILFFTKAEFPEYKEKFKRLKEEYKVTDEAQVVKKLIEDHESAI